MQIRKWIWTAAGIACWTAAAFAQTSTTTTTSTRQYAFPPVGLAASETAQINVVNSAPASSAGTAASCTGTISFVNATGAVIGTSTTFTVGTGQIASASLPFARLGASGSRAQFRGIVSLTTTRPATAPCALITSMEIYDTATGVTHVWQSGEGGGPGPGGH